eukprot:TRINITY_DN22693_c0_g1_i1.p1 TRINITY_DN22693_c0_g1~~TRINITY_DN22693_c0_g1_i1.p1  ORF type:complete len:213 (+),score=47.71 TRINITY_DN22693_c0_g1_i1:128-766(+)
MPSDEVTDETESVPALKDPTGVAALAVTSEPDPEAVLDRAAALIAAVDAAGNGDTVEARAAQLDEAARLVYELLTKVAGSAGRAVGVADNPLQAGLDRYLVSIQWKKAELYKGRDPQRHMQLACHALTTARTRLGATSDKVLELLPGTAAAYGYAGYCRTEANLLSSGVALACAVHGPTHAAVGAALHRLAVAQSALGRHHAAVRLLRRATK